MTTHLSSMKADPVEGLTCHRAQPPHGFIRGRRFVGAVVEPVPREEWDPGSGNNHGRETCAVAWVTCVIASYRTQFLARLVKEADFRLDIYHGQDKAGHSVSSGAQSAFPNSRSLRNIYWPTRRARVLWQCGAWQVPFRGYDVVVMNENVHNLSNWLLFLGKFLFRYRLVLVGYGYRPQPSRRLHARLRDGLRSFVLRRADSIVTYTEAGRREVCRMGIDPERVFVYGNTLDVDAIASTKRGLHIARPRRPAGARTLRLVYLGRLIPVKRPDLLIEAMRMLAAGESQGSGPVHLDIIGDGMQRPELERAASGLRNVHFHGALYDAESIGRILMQADVMVLPGRVGLTVIHAFCYGLPVVTTRHGVEQSPEFDYLEEGIDSVMLDRPDAAGLVRIIRELQADREALWRYRLRTARKARQFRMERMVREFINAVEAAAPTAPEHTTASTTQHR